MKLMQLVLASLLVLSLGACATSGNKNTQKTTSDNAYLIERAKEPVNFYYDFDDVLVPKEMKLNPKESLLFETPHVKAGLVKFSGRVEPVSLFNFFRTNMPKDGWQMRSYFKYGRYIIVFEKPEKDCIISITEGTLNTALEIWITPRINNIIAPAL